MFIRVFILGLVILGVSGCATMKRDSKSEEISGLHAQVADLESQIREKDTRISALEEELKSAEAVPEKTGTIPVPLAKISAKDIQRALKNAGYYMGAIDGKIGNQTKKAIRDFQQDNGLKADGIVGKKTWAALSPHLEKTKEKTK